MNNPCKFSIRGNYGKYIEFIKDPLGERHYINVSFECNRGDKFEKERIWFFPILNFVFGESMCEISSSPMSWAHLLDRDPSLIPGYDTMITTSRKLLKHMVMDTKNL